ncbi:MAG: transposase [Planctomycetota bacterium]|jgi:transposase
MNTQDNNEINIGIDTSQTVLDVFVRPSGQFQSFDNTPDGIKAAIRFIKPFKPKRVLIEATGRLELGFFCIWDRHSIIRSGEVQLL